MKDGKPSIDPELLLAQTTWVRGLAHQLIADPHRAEDATQEVLTTAVAHPPPRVVRGATLRAWLGRVLRNFVVTSRIREARRREREEVAARPERQDSASEIVERAEEHQLVVETVLDLDEPYRTALLLRFFAGLEADGIATKMGCSPEAARKRVSRGLERMRRALDQRFDGDRSSWHRSLVPLLPSSTWASRILKEVGRVVHVSSKAKLAVTGIVVLLGAPRIVEVSVRGSGR
jgi:RNA polymerase sigma factor (sigma-70 family)